MKKKIALLMAAVMLFGVTVGATIAYLTSITTEVKNTFTVGDIKITLDEAAVNEYGQKLDKDGTVDTDGANLAERVYLEEYKLIPGHKYVKDPTVHVQPMSENCYVFVKVVNGINAIETKTTSETIAAQMTAKGWKALGTTAPNVYYYIGTGETVNEDGLVVNTLDNTTLDLVVFESFTLATDAVVENYTTEKNAANVITIKAYAVQSDGMASAADAWTKAGFTA